MRWKTAISTKKDGELYVRGIPLADLLRKYSFVDGIFLLLGERLPKKNERELLDTILLACVEHGVEAPSGFVPRVVASTGNPMNAALAAGVLSIGDWHGGAVEQCAKILQSGVSAEGLVDYALTAKERIPGYGHKIYKDKDPRAEYIIAKAKKLKLGGKYFQKAVKIRELLKKNGKALPLNIDGALAAAMSELGFDWRLGKTLFILGRMPGMIAHAREEMLREKPYRRFEEEDVDYDGPAIKSKKGKKK
jgi:citryl-CoA lyase